jgi:hypothetical protein
MPEIPDVGAIAQQAKARIKRIEDQLKQHHVLIDELERLRAALVRLEDQGRSRVSTGRRNRKPAARAPWPCSARAARAPASQRGRAKRCASALTRSRPDR